MLYRLKCISLVLFTDLSWSVSVTRMKIALHENKGISPNQPQKHFKCSPFLSQANFNANAKTNSTEAHRRPPIKGSAAPLMISLINAYGS